VGGWVGEWKGGSEGWGGWGGGFGTLVRTRANTACVRAPARAHVSARARHHTTGISHSPSSARYAGRPPPPAAAPSARAPSPSPAPSCPAGPAGSSSERPPPRAAGVAAVAASAAAMAVAATAAAAAAAAAGNLVRCSCQSACHAGGCACLSFVSCCLSMHAARLSGRSGAARSSEHGWHAVLRLAAPPVGSVCFPQGSKHAVRKEGMGGGLPNPRRGTPREDGSLRGRLPSSGSESGDMQRDCELRAIRRRKR
jgi:hypothetical protein